MSVTAKTVVQNLLDEGPGPDPKDFIDQYHSETQPEFYFQHLKRDFDALFERMEQSGVLQSVLNKYDPQVLALAIMQLAIERSPLVKTRRAYLEIKRIGHSVML